MKISTLFLLSLNSLAVLAKVDASKPEEVLESPPTSPSLAISVEIKFPEAEIFGIKLVNGRATRAVLDFTNDEAEPVRVALIGGALTALEELPAGVHPSAAIIRNLTGTKYDVQIPAGETQSMPYTFSLEMMPQDLRLQIVAIVSTEKGTAYQVQAFNGTVSVVEAPTSLFDPQIIFLYLFLLVAFVSTLYFVYKTWIEALFPQSRRGGKGGERAKRSSGGTKKAAPIQEQVSVIDGDGPAVTTGAEPQKAWDEEWIPKHILKPEPVRRVKSGGSSKVKTKVVEK